MSVTDLDSTSRDLVRDLLSYVGKHFYTVFLKYTREEQSTIAVFYEYTQEEQSTTLNSHMFSTLHER